MKIILILLFLILPLTADTWFSAGLGFYYPLKHNDYSYDIGPGWNISVQHDLYIKPGKAFGFLMGVNYYSNNVNDFFYYPSSIKLKQNEIQLGLFYRCLFYKNHSLEVATGYISRGIEGHTKYQGVSLNDGGLFVQMGDQFALTENVALQGKLFWSFVRAETNLGELQISGPGIEIQLKFRILTSVL